jgi:hypothetical protein
VEEILRLAQIPTLALMTGTVVWVLWYTLAKAVPSLQSRHDGLVLAMQERYLAGTQAQREAAVQMLAEQRSFFERTLKVLEDRGSRDFEACETRHADTSQRLERIAVKLEELSYDLDLMAAPRHPGGREPKKGPGTKGTPP